MLQFLDVVDNFWCGHSRLTPSNGSWQNGASLVETSQYLGHTSVRDSQLPAYVARSHTELRQFHNLDSHLIGQGASIDEHATKLVNLAVPIGFDVCEWLKDELDINTRLFTQSPSRAG